VTDQAWDTLSIQAVSAAGVVYFLALLAYSAQWAARRGAVAGESSARAEVFGRFAFLLTGVAGGVHLLALVARGFAADPNRVPWGNMYEFTLTATFVVTLVTVLFFRRWNLAFLGPWAVGLVMVVLMLDVVWLYEPVAPLTEALSSPWLVIHVIAAITATGVFTLGGLVSMLYLARASGRLPSLPAAEVLDRIAYRLHAFAFPIWTFAVLIAGPIWAHQAWSRYWGWDPKEVWAFITWVVYAAYLHARATAGWKGRAAAIVALVGLATLWFNFIGINFFFGGGSIHSYAKQ
jgi:cytochrome c-type biogenesis protein CcsB